MKQSSERLTHAERTCLQLAARGQALDMIAAQFDDRTETVEKHLSSARKKLIATTTMEAVARALKLGLIE